MSAEPGELPELPPFPKLTQREISLMNLEKAHRSPRNAANRERLRRQNKTRARHITVEEALDIFNEELMTEGYVREMAKIMKRQSREGSQQSRYRAMLDWRDQVMGKPKLSRDEEELSPPTIVIKSPIFGAIADAKRKADGED